MQIIVHRVNKIAELLKIPVSLGVEVDVRCFGARLILNHEPHQDGEELKEYLNHYHHAFIIFNIKEAGIEEEVINLADSFGVKDYFLLDVEYPFIYRATHKMQFSKIAVRYSEAEPLEFALAHSDLVDWVWIDTNSKLPLDSNVVENLNGFKTCLVCPERWGRPEDIPKYIEQMKTLSFRPDAVMTSLKYVPMWEGLK